MKRLIFLCVFLTACAQNGKDGKSAASLPSTGTQYGLYEWSDPTPCAGPNNFGDGNIGCLQDVQVVSVVGGGAFVTTIASLNGATTATTIYLKPGTTTFTKKVWDASGSNSYTFTGDVSVEPPTFAANYDSDGLNNTAPKVFVLVEQ